MNLHVAIRSLRKNPVFTIISISVLALGIGANTAIFSVVNAVLLRPLPYRDPGRIVAVQTYWLKSQHTGQVSLPDFLDWRMQSSSFEAMSFYMGGWPQSVFANDLASTVEATVAEPVFFRVFGVQPYLGRVYLDSDKQNPTSVVVISQRFFDRVFGSDPHALGRTVKVMQHDFTVIGVMPHGFNFPDESDLWIPDYNFIISPWGQARTAHNFRSLALLKPGVSVASAQSEMKAIGARLAKEYPADDLPKSVAVTPLHDELVKRVRTTLYLLLGAVALVLLIACANVANLLLAKLAARKQEMAVRTALGASRSNLIRQLLLESLVLVVPAGLLGLLLEWWGGHALVLIAPPNLITKTDVPFDWHVALFAVAASLICTVLFGLAPALQGSTDDLHSALYAGGSYSVLRGGMGRLRSGIVIGEIAISMALLAGATVLVRSLIALNSVDPGYRAQGLWSMNADFPASNEEDAHHAVQFYLTLIDQARELPGMQDVAATNALPNEDTSNGTFDIEGRPGPAAGDYISQDAGFIVVSPGYFRVLGIPVLSGRDFNDHDTEMGQYTCIINHALVEKFFPDRDPVGQRIKDGYDSADKYMTIVGVVGDVRQESVDLPPIPFIYHPYLQHPLPATSMHILYRSNGENADGLRATARHLNPEVAVAFQPLAEVFERTFAPSRFRSTVLGLFAGLALLLALAGVYGVTSYMVTQRRSEICVRMALGARPLQMASLILRQGLGLVLAGVLIGAAITMAGARVFTSVVYGVKVSEPLVLLLIAAVQTLVAALAIYIPARRAAQVDPMLALRSE